MQNNNDYSQEFNDFVDEFFRKIEENEISNDRISISKDFFDYIEMDFDKTIKMFIKEGLLDEEGKPTEKGLKSGILSGHKLNDKYDGIQKDEK